MKKVVKLEKKDILPLLQEMIKNVKGEINENYDNSEIGKFVQFSLNYNHDFIEKAWADNPNIATHLESKFQMYYDQVGSYGVMTKFYANLDGGNREILENYIKSK